MTVALSIAGSDSGGGAGIQADLKTFEAFGLFGTTAITSVTAQNTCGVRAVADVPTEVVAAQIHAVLDDFPVAAIKLGMMSSAAIIHAVANLLKARATTIPIVLDPVMVATSGHRLLQPDAVRAVIEQLIPLATVLTPNLPEAEVLTGRSIASPQELHQAAASIAEMGAAAVLVKGGHRAANANPAPAEAVDLLLHHGEFHQFSLPWIQTGNTHGTGCTLSSAIAALVALGHPLPEAVRQAKRYVHNAMLLAPNLGNGNGPLLHSWQWETPHQAL
ncbi:MAG: bifunctional hydroxymethylpyrimidine kinase/phosphomethylpyrimidine kinase [Armatimonadetes bacterium]|nr:bifunctional hydroxymethylpyrimidine kinase/phosphomethylpyrimidine kinase [Armatimonadota bacterium]